MYVYHEVLKENNVHCANIEDFVALTSEDLIRIWYLTIDRLQVHKITIPAGKSALLEGALTPRVSLVALFGGQGPEWLPLLVDVHKMYQPIVQRFLQATVTTLLEQGLSLSSPPFSAGHGLFRWWVSDDSERPKGPRCIEYGVPTFWLHPLRICL